MVKSLRLILFALLALVVAFGCYSAAMSYFRAEEQQRAEGRLSLYHSTVTAEIEQFSHLTYVLARDAFVIDAASAAATGELAGALNEALNNRLKSFAAEAGLDAIYLMRPDGTTIATSNADLPESFIGKNYAFRPYFQTARDGEQGRFYGIGSTTGLPGYFIGDPVRNVTGALVGVVALKLDISMLEARWRSAGEQVMLVNQDGVVLLASDPDWRYRVLQPLQQAQRAQIETARQFATEPLPPLDWEPLAGGRARIGMDERLHLTASDLPQGWVLHYFASEERAQFRAALLTGGLLLIATLWLVVSQQRRARRIGAALQQSKDEGAQLREANDRLAVEIDERRAAERRLKRTQDELERASRLAALGQLAASVTHELGQPIAAMRNHLAAAEISGSGGRATPRIAALVDRMEGITRQLKFFARTEGESFAEVDLASAMSAAIELVRSNLDQAEVTLDWQRPGAPINVRANQLRLEQVMTNILRNAVDAVEGDSERRIEVHLGQSEHHGWFEVRDSGHGLGAATLKDLQEPFVTTRESGRGMGLGLAISANIIKEHAGTLGAQNLASGGAAFRVEIPLTEEGQDD